MEIIRTLGALIESPVPEHRRPAEILELGEPPAASVHSDLFLFQLYPYASVYLGSEGMLGGEARDRIAGFWRALGEEPPAEPDHIALLLSLSARLCDLEDEAKGEARRAAWRNARRAFFWEHLASWLPPYLDKLEAIAPPYYRRWAELLGRVLATEAREVGEPAEISRHLQTAPALEPPEEVGGEEFLGALLTPVRCGLILVRSDLERAARELELGSRIGERRYALRALLGQSAGPLLAWLTAEAESWAERHAARRAVFGATAAFWEKRAHAASRLLGRLAAVSDGP